MRQSPETSSKSFEWYENSSKAILPSEQFLSCYVSCQLGLLKWHSSVSVRVLMSFLGCSNAALTLIWVPVTEAMVEVKYNLKTYKSWGLLHLMPHFATWNLKTRIQYMFEYKHYECFDFRLGRLSVVSTFYQSSKMAPGPCHLCPLSLHHGMSQKPLICSTDSLSWLVNWIQLVCALTSKDVQQPIY